jgi:hypothetical protein
MSRHADRGECSLDGGVEHGLEQDVRLHERLNLS